MVQQEIKFTPSTATTIDLYFDAEDFNLSDMADEVNKFIRDNFILKDNSVEFEGDCTRVPVIKHKWKLIRVNNLWDD